MPTQKLISMSNEAKPPTTEAKETRWSESSRARPSESQANVSSNVRYGHGPIKAPATASPRRQVEGKKSLLRQQKIIPFWGRIAVASCMTAPVCQTEGDQPDTKAAHRPRPVARSGIHSKFRAMGMEGGRIQMNIN